MPRRRNILINERSTSTGIERREEMTVLCDLDIFTMQAFFFVRPELGKLPHWASEKQMVSHE